MKRTIRIALPFLILAAVLVASGCGSGSKQSIPDGAVAVVDGTPITKASLDDLIGRAKQSYVSQKRAFPKAGTTEYQALQSQGVAFLVQRAEYAKEAEKRKLAVTDKEIQARIDQIKKQYFAGSQAKFDAGLKEQGYTLAGLRADVEAQLVSEKLYSIVTKGITVTDAEIQKYYTDNKKQYEVAESRDVRHILVKNKALADKIYAELKAGGDFAALAKKYSQDPGSKDKGGKLTITRGQTVAAFDATAFLLTTNQLSKPVKTEFGYHVIQALSAIRPGKTTPLKDVKAQIKSQLEQQKKSAATQKWAAATTKAYDKNVKYTTGYAPPAAATTSTATQTTTG
jgi:foldase protein PrsA